MWEQHRIRREKDQRGKMFKFLGTLRYHKRYKNNIFPLICSSRKTCDIWMILNAFFGNKNVCYNLEISEENIFYNLENYEFDFQNIQDYVDKIDGCENRYRPYCYRGEFYFCMQACEENCGVFNNNLIRRGFYCSRERGGKKAFALVKRKVNDNEETNIFLQLIGKALEECIIEEEEIQYHKFVVSDLVVGDCLMMEEYKVLEIIIKKDNTSVCDLLMEKHVFDDTNIVYHVVNHKFICDVNASTGVEDLLQGDIDCVGVSLKGEKDKSKSEEELCGLEVKINLR